VSDPTRLGPSSATAYVAANPHLKSLVGIIQRVEQPAGGNINVVVRVVGSAGSIVLKQSLAYARVVEDWPMSPHRTRVEAELYTRWAAFAPDAVPAVLHFDPALNVLVLEDLSDHRLWRSDLNEGHIEPEVAEHLGRALGACAFHTSLLTQDAASAHEVGSIADPGLEQLMEDVQFNQPWTDHPRNAVPEEILADVRALRSDPAFATAVARLHWAFRNQREVLSHGDLHTGSVMVKPRSVRVIDSEFARLGPAAWDLSQLWGNLLLAAIGAVARDPGRIDPILGLMEILWDSFRMRLTELWPSRTTPLHDSFLHEWLDRTESLAIGFAGIEAGRRPLGLGKVPDIEEVPPPSLASARRAALTVARDWAKSQGASLSARCAATRHHLHQERWPV
jgi:5-methylthioribose kinase